MPCSPVLNNVQVFFPLYAVVFTVGKIFCSVFPQVLQVPMWYSMVCSRYVKMMCGDGEGRIGTGGQGHKVICEEEEFVKYKGM